MESSLVLAPALSGEGVPEPSAPAIAQGRAASEKVEFAIVWRVAVADAVQALDGPVFEGALHEFELLPRSNDPRLDHSEIPAREARLLKPEGELLVPTAGDLPAGGARLSDLYEGFADCEGVSDADGAFVETEHREVFPERRGGESSTQTSLPVGVVFRRIDADRLVGTAVMAEVGLRVAGKPIVFETDGSLDGLFEQRGPPRAWRTTAEPGSEHLFGLAHLYRPERRRCRFPSSHHKPVARGTAQPSSSQLGPTVAAAGSDGVSARTLGSRSASSVLIAAPKTRSSGRPNA